MATSATSKNTVKSGIDNLYKKKRKKNKKK